ncbi:tRNA (adenosine(37)-N6)-threonylcarbamoyltransferase complex ATPase subunit type 1 TsaE [Desulfobulbus propionicus]
MVTPSLQLTCSSPEALIPVAEVLAGLVKEGDVVLLHGPLGAGKTTFTQALARALEVGDEQYVSSPSFALLHEYRGRLPIAHMDLYRLTDEDEVEAAGLLDYLGHDGVCIVEWPERLGMFIPENRLDILLQPVDATTRRLLLSGHGQDWQQRLAMIITQLSGLNPQALG